ncbi:MAG: class I SAM-dependent methyltransferase, partial [Burkholderiales bacterium]|nr:class I SAM-dependent methyltransferase [Burkholderiales bacterium]
MTYRKRIAQFATKAIAFPSARIAVAVFALLAGGSATASSTNTDEPLKSAIAGEQRSAAHKQRDAARHPYETLQFFGIRPDMHVVEIIPGGGWYTEILAPYLRDHGKLILAAPDPASASDYSRRSAANLKKKLEASPAVFDQVSVGVFEPPANIHFADNNSVDMVLTFRNVHNWAADGDATVQSVFQHIYDSLKPGGVFGVVDHRLPV